MKLTHFFILFLFTHSSFICFFLFFNLYHWTVLPFRRIIRNFQWVTFISFPIGCNHFPGVSTFPMRYYYYQLIFLHTHAILSFPIGLSAIPWRNTSWGRHITPWEVSANFGIFRVSSRFFFFPFFHLFCICLRQICLALLSILVVRFGPVRPYLNKNNEVLTWYEEVYCTTHTRFRLSA